MLSVSAEAEAQLLAQLSAPVAQPQQIPAAPVPVPQAGPHSSSSFSRHVSSSGRHGLRLNSCRRSLEARCPLRAGLARCQLSSSPKLEVSTSLRTVLVQLEHTASVHASRLKERLHCGLARLTSFTPQAEGVLRLPVGREVLRDWEFGPEIGCGASCVTRLVMSRATGQAAACKTINKSGIFRSAALKAAMLGVQRELAIMQHTSGHPHVVQLRGVYEDARALHLVMDWCAGGCLESLVSTKLPDGKLGEAAAAAVAQAVLEVLAHVHGRGVVHRDIKPGNVLLCSLNEDAPGELTTDNVKVTDFGISLPYTPGRPLTELAGTLDYMAPEVLQRCYGPAADVWSTGVMLHELLCGQLPFSGDTLEQMAQCIQKTEIDLSGPAWSGVSHDAKQLVALCLQKDPRDRPSARQLLDTFADWLELGSGF
ncbi:kinase-like domain-containing protein [Scenedesmus sp. NREL 46B-D3]|nr:kinase-like domain-containing protein [Scenedesmus sp. NREL 46B-D3]